MPVPSRLACLVSLRHISWLREYSLCVILADEKTEECLKVRGEDGVEVESCTHQSYARAVEAREPRE